MLWQAADLLLWNPLDMEAAIRRADAVRRLVENVQHRHGGDGTPRGMPRKPQKRPYNRPMGMAGAHLVAAGESP
jgi:hypothetical protein